MNLALLWRPRTPGGIETARRPVSKAATAVRSGRRAGAGLFMMRLTGNRACATAAALAPLRLTTGRRAGSLIGALTDPHVRLGVGAAALLVTALAVRRDRVSL